MWNKIEMLDCLSVHDEEWLIENDEGERAVGIYSCGDLVEVVDVI